MRSVKDLEHELMALVTDFNAENEVAAFVRRVKPLEDMWPQADFVVGIRGRVKRYYSLACLNAIVDVTALVAYDLDKMKEMSND